MVALSGQEKLFFCSSGFSLRSGLMTFSDLYPKIGRLIQTVILSPFYSKELALQNQFAPAFSIAFQHHLPPNKSFYQHSNTFLKASLVRQE